MSKMDLQESLILFKIEVMNNENDQISKIFEFLAQPVPGGRDLPPWKLQCADLGNSAPFVFLHALRTKGVNAQYAAILGLRIHGWEAEGRVDEVTNLDNYYVREPGANEWICIEPLIRPSDDPGVVVEARKPSS